MNVQQIQPTHNSQDLKKSENNENLKTLSLI